MGSVFLFWMYISDSLYSLYWRVRFLHKKIIEDCTLTSTLRGPHQTDGSHRDPLERSLGETSTKLFHGCRTGRLERVKASAVKRWVKDRLRFAMNDFVFIDSISVELLLFAGRIGKSRMNGDFEADVFEALRTFGVRRASTSEEASE